MLPCGRRWKPSPEPASSIWPPIVETVVAEHEIEPEIAALLVGLERRFGKRFVALYLFGSRVRGDHQPDSDVDVAAALDQEMPQPFDVTREILEDTYDLLLDTGYYIRPWPLEKAVSKTPSPTPTRRSAARCSATGHALAHAHAHAAGAAHPYGTRIG